MEGQQQNFYKINRLEGSAVRNRNININNNENYDGLPKTLISNVNINNTLIVSHSIRPYDNDIENANEKFINSNIWIYDNILEEYKPLFVNSGSLFFNGNLLIDNANLIPEINNAFHPAEGPDFLAVSNIAILGQPDTHNGYINFSLTQGEDGIGLRYDKTAEKIQFRHSTLDNWANIASASRLALLDDVNVSGVVHSELLMYDGMQEKWVNTDSPLVNSITITSNINISEEGSYINIGGSPIVSFDKIGNGNHINFLSYGTPRIAAAGDASNIDISLSAKNDGDVNIIGERINIVGNLSVNGNVDYGGYMKSSVIVYPNGDTPAWLTSELNAVSFGLGVAVIFFSLREMASGDYYAVFNTAGIETGYNLTIFFDDEHNDNKRLFVDMGVNGIIGGNGDFARYLRFDKSGQSARLMYFATIEDIEGENNLNRWYIVGAGCGIV